MSAPLESLFVRQQNPPKPFPISFPVDDPSGPLIIPNLLYYHENNETHILFVLTLTEIFKYNLDKQIDN